MSADKLEGAVLDHIKNLYSHPKVQENITYTGGSQDENDREKTIARLDRDIESGPMREQRHQEAYERGVETIEQLDAHISRIREEVQKSRMEKERLLILSTATTHKVAITRKLVASLKDFDACWDKMELDERKMILRSIIKEIRAGDNKVEIDFIF